MALAAKAATTTIPIVFTVSDDPVRLGLVASLARPGGNATGINFFIGELVAKRLELLRALVPAATRVAVLVNPADAATTETPLRALEPAARAMGLQIQILNASTSREINTAFATFVRERPDALFVYSDPFFNSRRIAIDPPGVAPCDPHDIFGARLCRSRRANELRNQRCRCVASGRRLYRPHPQGRQACGLAGGAVEQVRAGHQRRDRPDARPHRAAHAARHRRRGDRVSLTVLHLLAAGYVHWHFSAVPTAPSDVRFQGGDLNRSTQHLLILLDKEVADGDVTDIVHGEAEG